MLNGRWNGHSEQNDKCDNKCDCITHSEWKNWWAGWKHNKFAGIEMAGVISTKILLIHKYDTFPHKTSCQNTILYWQLTQIFMKLMFLTNPIRLTMVENCGTDVQEAMSSSYGPHKGDWVWTNKCNVTWWECSGEKFSSWLKVFTQGALHIRSNWLLGLPTAFMF